MTPVEFEFVSQLLKRRSGLVLTADKGYLLQNRLGPVARKHSLAGLSAIAAKLRTGDETLARDVTEAMTTNETFFFRDKAPFSQFENVMLPALLKARAGLRRLRIWCAAASTGQEPYSLAMLLAEKASLVEDWRVEIVGTDLSAEALTRAKTGLYSHFEVQRGLPIRHLVKHFTKERDQWRLKDNIRAMVALRQVNLLDPFVGLGSFDVVFCRNVLSAFDETTRRGVVERIAQVLPKDGYMLVGAGETLAGSFSPLAGAAGVYVKAPANAATKASVA